jgi:hypothetical protein
MLMVRNVDERASDHRHPSSELGAENMLSGAGAALASSTLRG